MNGFGVQGSRFKVVVAALSRIVIPSAAEGSFLHYGQYHIGTGRETTPWYFCFHTFFVYRSARKISRLRSK